MFYFQSETSSPPYVHQILRKCQQNIPEQARKDLIDALFGWAVKHNQIALATDLIQYTPKMNQTDSQGITPLMYAMKFRQIHLAKVILEKGARINAIDKKGRTALIHATHDINIMYDFPEEENWTFWNWRHYSWYVNILKNERPCSEACVRLLLEKGARTFYSVEQFSSKEEKEDGSTKIYWQRVASDQIFRATALMPAAWAGCLQCVRMIASHNTISFSEQKQLNHIMGFPDHKPEIYQAIRNSCTKYTAKDTLFNVCKFIIRRHLMRVSKLGLFLALDRLPIPRRLKNMLWMVSDQDDEYEYVKYQGTMVVRCKSSY